MGNKVNGGGPDLRPNHRLLWGFITFNALMLAAWVFMVALPVRRCLGPDSTYVDCGVFRFGLGLESVLFVVSILGNGVFFGIWLWRKPR
jgi:hypothetical protein